MKFLEWVVAGDITPSEVILNTLLALIGVAVLVSLIRIHLGNGTYKKFNLVHLLVNKEGFLDGSKCFEVVAFALMSWGFIVFTTAKTLPEWYVQIFVVAFVIRGGYGAYLRSKGSQPEEAGTTVVTETAIKTTEVTKKDQPAEVIAQDVTVKAEGDVSVVKAKKGKA